MALSFQVPSSHGFSSQGSADASADTSADTSADASGVDWVEQHCLYSQRILEEMAQVKIVLNELGLSLIAPNRNTWQPDDMATGFAEMPEAFARSYLQLRLRNFLYETFCRSAVALDSVSEVSSLDHSSPEALGVPALINDRVGGGLHVGLLEDFERCNQGKGYFDPGWEVVRTEPDGAIAVQKHGIVVHAQPRHLLSEKEAEKHAVQPGEQLAIRLPAYRFEPDFYIAIGNQGPVPDIHQAQEIYFSATAAAMPLIMKTLTTALNGDASKGDVPKGDVPKGRGAVPSVSSVPYTLQVPYELEGYHGPEAIVLRIASEDFDQVLPCLQQIWEMCSQLDCSQLEKSSSVTALRPALPLFAYPLWPGISMADVIESSATEWFGSSVELSRLHLVAEALTQVWYESLAEKPNTRISSLQISSSQNSSLQNLLAMQAQFSQAQLSWAQPFKRELQAS